MKSRWFPHPEEEAGVVLLEPSGTWTPGEVLALLTSESATEWRHKVGVAGPSDGSARPATRLLLSRGWVLKSRLDVTFPTEEAGKAAMLATRTVGRRAGLWHPDKTWGVLKSADAWYPLTICRELTTLRQITRREERMAAWIDMFQAAIDVDRLHGVGLDVNPSNFGREPGGTNLYYVDDDLYPRLERSTLGGAIASRLPEEPAATPADWSAWASLLRSTLSIGAFTWSEIVEEIRKYPMAERYIEPRAALVEELSRTRTPRRARVASRLTCVLADVHGNLPALDAVLADARRRGATDYLFLGDAVGYGPQPRECVERLAELRPSGVRGNHDHAIATGRFDLGMNSLARECAEWSRAQLGATELEWLAALPLEQKDDGWLAVHGAPKDPQRFLAYVYELTYEENLRHLRAERIPVCFYGHTHVQLTHVELAGGPSKLPGPRTFQLTPQCWWLVNPGSVGQPRDGDPRAAYAVWNRDTGEVDTLRVAYDVARTLAAQRAAGLPARLDQRLVAGA